MSCAPHLTLFRAIVQVARARNYHLLAYHDGRTPRRNYASQACAEKKDEDEVATGYNSASSSSSSGERQKILAARGLALKSDGSGVSEGSMTTNGCTLITLPSWRPQEALAILEQHLERVEIPTVPRPSHTPNTLNKPIVTPKRRSRFLSQFHSQDAQVRYSAYASLFLETSSSATFTPTELYHVAKSTARTVGIPQSHQKRRMKGILEELEQALGGRDELGGGKVTKIVAAGRQSREVSLDDLSEAERVFAGVWPDAEDMRYANRPTFTSAGNHLLYLAAKVPTAQDFARIEAKLVRCGFKHDKYSWLAHITLMDRQRRYDSIPAVVARALSHATVAEDQIIILNAALWSFARQGRWEMVGPTYNTLLANRSPDITSIFNTSKDVEFFSSPPHQDLYVPPGLSPSIITYRLLINALAYHGNFIPAITVFQHMISLPGGTHLPCVADYNALFLGFTRFGIIAQPSDNHVRLVDFVHAASIPLDSQQSRSRTLSAQSKSRGHRLAELWERGTTASAAPSINHAHQDSNEWTFEALNSLLTAFLALHPPLQGVPLAPSPQAVYYLLVAFGRVSGSDKAGLKEVFEAVRAKFGAGNSEGWVGWSVNERLQRVLELWEEPAGQNDIREA